jgi:hypothetical protein
MATENIVHVVVLTNQNGLAKWLSVLSVAKKSINNLKP